MYQIGNLIFYESSGVCKVMGVTMRDLTGQNKEQLYYVLEPLYQNYIIFTLVNTTKVFMRPIISKNEAERLVDMMPTIQARAYHNRVLSQLTQHYNALLKTHDCSDLVKLSMSLRAKKQGLEQQKRKFGAVDERFMKRAEELLFGELAAALDIPKDRVPEYIADRVSEKRSDNENGFNA
jgi:CarD family transcriptional regulator